MHEGATSSKRPDTRNSNAGLFHHEAVYHASCLDRMHIYRCETLYC